MERILHLWHCHHCINLAMSKQPAKRAAKRKAADDIADTRDSNVLASLDLSSSISVRDIADALLNLLPEGATKQHPSAKKLAKAFPIVIATLDNRSNTLARKSEEDGQRAQLAFRFPIEGEGKLGDGKMGEGKVGDGEESEQFTTIEIPEETFAGVLKFLDGREITKASLVCKSWLVSSRLPSLWEKLDATCGLTNKSRKLNMTIFTKLLARPQFSCLKHIVMPHHSLQLSKTSIAKMAKLLPNLETFEMPSVWATGPKLKDEHIVSIAENFSQLTAIRNIEMWSISNSGIANMAQTMGGKLLDLRINGSIYYLADSGLRAIAFWCPNLEYFSYKISWGYNAGRDYLSGDGVVNLIRKCRRLEIVELKDARNVTREHFEEILSMVEEGDDDEEFALRKINLEGVGYTFIIEENPLRIVDKEAHNNVQISAADLDRFN